MPKRILDLAGWLAGAALSAYAGQLTLQHSTPIDRALPLIGAVLSLIGGYLAVPLVIAVEIAFADETTRLLALGVVVAGGFVWSALPAGSQRNGRLEAGAPSSAPGSPASSRPFRRLPAGLAVGALLLLRWIPFAEVRLAREVFILLCTVAIVWLLRSTPFAILFAVVIGLITPAVPMRTLALPLVVVLALAIVRFFNMPRIALTVPSLFVLASILTFFAWSGVVARAFPYFGRERTPEWRRHVVNAALAPSRSVVVDVPPDATGVIVSGANVAHLRRGALLGRMDPGAIPIRIGDGADWGYMRRDFYYGTHNPLPRVSAGTLRGYGYGAWVDGAGRIQLPPNAKTVRFTADPGLPRDAALQVEGFSLR